MTRVTSLMVGLLMLSVGCVSSDPTNGDGCSSACRYETPAGCNLQSINDSTTSFDVTSAAFCSVLFRIDGNSDVQFYDPMLDSGTLTVDQLFVDACSSPEFAADFATVSDTDFVNKLYLRMLYRVPQSFEVSFYVSALATTSRATICQDFSQSPEFNSNRLWPMLNRFRTDHNQPTH